MQQQTSVAWHELMARLGVPAAAAATTFARLADRYRRPPRAYHSLHHARQVVAAVDKLARYAPSPDTVRLAAWFHDVVYVPGAKDNEAQSVTYATRALTRLQVAPARIRETERLILLTATHRVQPGDGNGQVLSDADLAILGAPPAVYDAYARAIRQEYAFVAPEPFRQGRLHVLRRLLARPAIYHTPVWQRQRESQARQNMWREIARLDSPISS